MKIAAVITETRHIDLTKTIEDHFKFLPDYFDCVVFHYENQVNYDCIKHKLEKNITNIRDYNDLMTSEWFWDKLPYEKVLIFQTDSGILRHGIEDFYHWGYVGAPWMFQEIGGNGGLSLRDVDVMQYAIRSKPYNLIYGFEDVYYSNFMHEKGLKLAPREVCKKFSCETIFELGTLGYHSIHKYMNQDQVNKIKTQYDKIYEV